METILAGAEQLKKTIILGEMRMEVPGYQTAMCIMFGIAILLTLQFLFIASEYVPRSPRDPATLTLDCAAKEPWVTL